MSNDEDVADIFFTLVLLHAMQIHHYISPSASKKVEMLISEKLNIKT